MTDQQQQNENSSSSDSDTDDEENVDAIDPILAATNAGAHLSVPMSASISRKRKLHVNKGKYKGRARNTCATKRTCAWDRLKEYPNEHLAVVNGNLRCSACSETLSLKKSSIGKHIKSSKHSKGISRIVRDKKESQSIMECLQRLDKRENPSGSTLPEEMRVFRFEVVEGLLSGGIPLSNADVLRPIFEKYGHRLTSATNLAKHIPAVLEKERGKIKSELEGVKEASVIFDGTARLGEALAVIIRYVQEDFQPTQRLIRLEVLAKSLNGSELAQRLMSCLAVDHKFGPKMIIGGMRDGASVNGSALKQLKFFYPNLMDIVCFSHTIDNVGAHFVFRILDLLKQ